MRSYALLAHGTIEVIETESYISELLGRNRKPKENLQDFLSPSSRAVIVGWDRSFVSMNTSNYKGIYQWSTSSMIQSSIRAWSGPSLQVRGSELVYWPRRAVGYKGYSEVNAVSVWSCTTGSDWHSAAHSSRQPEECWGVGAPIRRDGVAER